MNLSFMGFVFGSTTGCLFTCSVLLFVFTSRVNCADTTPENNNNPAIADKNKVFFIIKNLSL